MKNKYRLIISTITLSIFILMSVGFAIYGSHLAISGTATFSKDGGVSITNAVLVSSSNMIDPQDPTFTANSITFNLNFNVKNNGHLSDDYSAVFQITIENDSVYDHDFTSSTFTPSLETANNEDLDVTYTVSGIEAGEVIPSKSTKTFTVTFNMYPKKPGDYNVSGGSDVITEPEEQQVTVRRRR